MTLHKSWGLKRLNLIGLTLSLETMDIVYCFMSEDIAHIQRAHKGMRTRILPSHAARALDDFKLPSS